MVFYFILLERQRFIKTIMVWYFAISRLISCLPMFNRRILLTRRPPKRPRWRRALRRFPSSCSTDSTQTPTHSRCPVTVLSRVYTHGWSGKDSKETSIHRNASQLTLPRLRHTRDARSSVESAGSDTPLIDHLVMREFVSGPPSYRFIYERVRDRKPSLRKGSW